MRFTLRGLFVLVAFVAVGFWGYYLGRESTNQEWYDRGWLDGGANTYSWMAGSNDWCDDRDKKTVKERTADWQRKLEFASKTRIKDVP